MFNGIIFNQGIIKNIQKEDKGIELFVKSNLKIRNKDIGVSISCDGACLTLISIKNKVLKFFLSKETLDRSKFKKIKTGDRINLELPIKFGQNISGHLCQGHVDTTAKLIKKQKKGKAYLYEFNINKFYKKYLLEKASILINGVSLTISKVKKNSFQTWIIPHTLKLTNLSMLKKNELANIEIDILSKYIKKHLDEKK